MVGADVIRIAPMYRIASTLLALAGLTCATAAGAQSVTDVVVMRRAIAPPNPTVRPTPTPTPTPVKCAALASSKFVSPVTATLGSATSVSQAQGMCDAARVSRGVGSCAWVGYNGYSDYQKVYWSSNVTTTYFNSSGASQIYAASCS